MTAFLALHTYNADETQAVGRLLGELAQPGDLFLLSGALGAGKTTLTQGIVWGLGATEHARSPTFVLVNEYAARLPVFHVDLFRLSSPAEALDLGLEEYLQRDGVVVIEWAEKAEEALPQEHLWVELAYQGHTDHRVVRLKARGRRYRNLLAQLEAAARARGLGGLRDPGH